MSVRDHSARENAERHERWSLFVTGGSGYLGHEVTRVVRERGIPFEAPGRSEGIDLLQPFELEDIVAAMFARCDKPPLLIHLAAWSRQSDCDHEPENAFRANAEATGALATVVARFGGRMVYTSTDLVFDGADAPYDEDAEANPISVYGRSKLLGERYVRTHAHDLIIRIPLLYGPSFDGLRGASDPLLNAAREGRELRLFDDEWRTPLDVREAATRIVDLALSDAVHVRHVAGKDRLSRYELGMRILRDAGLEASGSGFRITATKRGELRGSPRPEDCSLVSLF
ncbi:MAG: SDR family oxidoreductase [Planctomycetes bacterium]|nr:SDR family oxidoreductase [Planctomycetota bacterium]